VTVSFCEVKRIALIGVLSALVLIPAITFSTSSATASISSTPQSTVHAYYQAIGLHHWKIAASFLQPSQRSSFYNAPDSDRNNTVSLSDINASKGAKATLGNPAVYGNQYPGYSDIWQVFVTYGTTYKHVYGAESGSQSRFIYLGRKHGSGPWQILEIGTGP
jgi:hypothetical protein